MQTTFGIAFAHSATMYWMTWAFCSSPCKSYSNAPGNSLKRVNIFFRSLILVAFCLSVFPLDAKVQLVCVGNSNVLWCLFCRIAEGTGHKHSNKLLFHRRGGNTSQRSIQRFGSTVETKIICEMIWMHPNGDEWAIPNVEERNRTTILQHSVERNFLE